MVPGSGFIHNNENNHLGRIWLFCWNKVVLDVKLIHKHVQSISYEINTLKGENHWVQTVVLERKDLWQQLRSVKQSIDSHARLILGDFNVVRDLSEKWNGLRLNSLRSLESV